MDAFILASVTVATVLIVSGIAKLKDPAGVRVAFEQMKVPPALSATWIQRSFPWVEIALGAGLLVLPFPLGLLSAIGAFVLFGAYTFLVARSLASKQEASCNCFGALTSGKITGWTLARNVALLVLAAFAIADTTSWWSVLARLFTVGFWWLFLLAVVAFLGYASVRGDAVAVSRIAAALGVSSPVAGGASAVSRPADAVVADDEPDEYVRKPNPPAVLLDRDGQPVTLETLTQARPVLMIWLSFGCGPCGQVVPRVPDYARRLPEVDVKVVVDTARVLDAAPDDVRELCLVDPQSTLGRSLGNPGTPSAILFGADGMLAGGPVAGPGEIDDMISEMEEQLAETRLASSGAAEGLAAEGDGPERAAGTVISGEVVPDEASDPV